MRSLILVPCSWRVDLLALPSSFGSLANDHYHHHPTLPMTTGAPQTATPPTDPQATMPQMSWEETRSIMAEVQELFAGREVRQWLREVCERGRECGGAFAFTIINQNEESTTHA